METLYLDTNDEITAVIDRIKNVKGIDIVLVVPKRSVLTQSIVNLKLLKKHVDMTGKNVVVVISEEVAANLAARVGLQVRPEVPRFSSEMNSVATSPKEVVNDAIEEKKDDTAFEKNDNDSLIVNQYVPPETQIAEEEDVEIDLPNLEIEDDANSVVASAEDEVDSDDDLPQRKKAKSFFVPKAGFKILFIFLLLSSIVAALLLFVLLPKATITIVPKTEIQTSQFDVAVLSSVTDPDFDQRRIPGSLIFTETTTDQKTFEAVGEKDVSTKARGVVTVYNSYSSSPQPLVANTRLQSANGGIYRTLRDVQVPGATIEEGTAVAGTLQIEVEAETAGDEYNYDVGGNLSIPGLSVEKQGDIYAQVTTKIDGGEKKVVRVVSEDDLERAENSLLNEYSENLSSELSNQVSSEQFFFNDAVKLEVVERFSSVETDSEATDFNLSVKIRASTLVFARDYIEEIASRQAFSEVGQDQVVVEQDIDKTLSAELLNLDFEQEEMGVNVRIERILYKKLNEDVLKDAVKGRDSQFISDYLTEQDEIQSVSVGFWPFWVSSAPRLGSKIEFVLDIDSKLDSM